MRLPAKALAASQPMKENVPGPIVAVRGRSGNWLGRGWLEHPEGVYRMTPTLRARGPVFADYRVEYELTNGCYVAEMRIIAGTEVALVTEEFDTGAGAFKFSLYEGLQPDTGRWRGHSGRPAFAPGYGGGRSGKEAVSPLKYDREGQIFGLAGWMTWWPDTGFYWGVYNSNNPRSDYLGIFRVRSGQWRNPTWPGIVMSRKPDLVATFGLGAGKRQWGLYNSTAAEAIPGLIPDVELPEKLDTAEKVLVNNRLRTQMRETSRSPLNRAMIKYGEMPLDKYKDWILDWPGADADVYPRMFVAPGQLETVRERALAYPPIKARLGAHTAKPLTYLVTGNEAMGRQLYDAPQGGDYNWMGQMLRMQTDVTEWLEGEGDTGTAMHNLHGQIRIRGNALRYDAAGAVKELTPAERRRLRALMAFEAHKAADLDWVPFGTGFHLGNPNMPTAVAATIGLCGAALPSHPYAGEWMDRAYRYIRDTLNGFVAPGGAWNECPHYQMDASLQQILQLATALKNTGYADLYREPKLKATMRYAAEIWTPVDTRTGYRVMPSIGHSGLESTALFGWMAAGTRDSDPGFAAEQQWMWANGGKLMNYPFDELVIDPAAPTQAPAFISRNFPGFGVILRSGAPAPDETYLSFRAGYWTSHYEDGDQGSLVLYARGAPLCLDFASQYAPTVGRQYMHNRVSFNHRYSRDSGRITAFAAGPRADYARGRVSTTTLMQLPETPEEEAELHRTGVLQPNTMPPTETVKPINWDRQVLFIKDPDPAAPNYLVLRESFSGNTTLPTDWNLWTLATGVTWEGNRATAAAMFGGVLLDVVMLDPTRPAWSTGEWAHKFLPGNTTVQGWKDANPDKPYEERQKLLRVAQGPGQCYFAVLYPRLATEQAPTVTAVADGKAAKVEHVGGMDLVILLPDAVPVQAEGVMAQAAAATVSRRKGSLTLSLLDGTSLMVEGQGGFAQAGAGSATLIFTPTELTLTTDGAARELELALPARWLAAALPADCPFALKERRGGSWVLAVPAGKAAMTVTLP
ncbi:MAG: hypothetical protein BWY76_01692 [bacterium ADurb.Bin429]|nr:MAG: hypothetical protein BWY76_01692 [bacterium ADurb.Bin429]